ncbi:hypothetical protein DVQ41_03215 [Yersinia enterocolitica]|uniref:Uncharacterized protein n=1 Tax=Yersinia enterocolitica subsp. palearctica serotype O:3 (strain DSM 13030 / CIP 106945 / Y11) TaxID=930944 RepID=A0A0H3NPT6_YERE1|nr:hypothetical protein [Yersinia enterocolitica]QBP99807.1 hypothetical protein YEY1_14140 [Yersinia enterocolitica subsp. palearctica]CBY26417.1 hypothetical protein Y11_17641 [Yersinia enterocolitica subsp. palearctica Y11]CCO69367.1 hypothetical protein D322_2493 [Yersinia enterocolitica IP 10393]EKN5957550.1 hypothetical protein [Yersinia enterocolitica]
MSLIPQAHPAGSINAVQIGSRPICLSLAAFLQLELFRLQMKCQFIANKNEQYLRNVAVIYVLS